MAKVPPANDPAEVTIFFARVRGGGSVVADSVQKLANALQHAQQPPPAVRVVRALPQDVKANEQTLFDPVEPTDDAVATEQTASSGDGVVPPRTPRGEGPKTDRNASIIPASDVSFRPEGKKSLQTFFSEKAPSTDMEQVLVICYWLERIAAVAAVSRGHVLSGLREVAKPIPKDLTQTIRNMGPGNKKKAWLNVSEIDKLRLSTIGSDYVDHKLGKSREE